MTIQKPTNFLIYGLSSDTKPTNYSTNTLFVETDTGLIYRYNGSSWVTLYLPSTNTWTGYNYFNLTAAGGFEDVAKWSIGSSLDYFALSNNVNGSGSFAPIFRCNGTSTNFDRFTPVMFFQTIGKSANDTTDADSLLVFCHESPGHALLVNRPLAAFRNGLSPAGDVLQIFPTYVDHKNNSIKNTIIKPEENTLYGIRQDPTVKRTGIAQPSSLSAAATAANIVNLDGILTAYTPTGAGTNTQTWDTTEGMIMTWASSTTASAQIGLVPPAGGIGQTRRAFATRARIRSKIDSTTSGRYYFGFSSASALPAASDTVLATADSGILVGFSTASTNWTIYAHSGSGTMTQTNVTGPIAKNAAYHTIEINWTAGGNPTIIFDGVSQTVSTDLPATTTNLFFHAVAQNSTTTARSHLVKGVWLEVAG